MLLIFLDVILAAENEEHNMKMITYEKRSSHENQINCPNISDDFKES